MKSKGNNSLYFTKNIILNSYNIVKKISSNELCKAAASWLQDLLFKISYGAHLHSRNLISLITPEETLVLSTADSNGKVKIQKNKNSINAQL